MSIDADATTEGPPEGYTGEATVRGLQATVECIETIRRLMADRIAQAVPNNAAMANAILKQLGELRSLLHADGPRLDVTRTLARTNFIELITTNVSTLLRFENVTDECLRVLVPLTRLSSDAFRGGAGTGADAGAAASEAATAALQQDIMAQILRHGGVVFVLLALRGYMNSSLGVRLQGLELLAALLEYCALGASEDVSAAGAGSVSAASEAVAAPASPAASPSGARGRRVQSPSTGQTRYDYSGAEARRYASATDGNPFGSAAAKQALRSLVALPDNQMALDAVHQLLLHGAGVVLVRLLRFSSAARSEVSVRRAVWCLRFLVLGTPTSLAFKIASFDQYACIRDLATQLRAAGLTTRLEAAVLLTGLLASHVEVAAALTRLGGWDDLSSVLAQNAEHVCAPPAWLSCSLDNIRVLGQRDTQAIDVDVGQQKRPKGVPGKRNSGADDISAVETAILHKCLQQTSASSRLGAAGMMGTGMDMGDSVDVDFAESASLEDVVTNLLTKTHESARQRAIRWSRPGSRNGIAGMGSRPGSRGASRTKSQPGGITLDMGRAGMTGAASAPDLLDTGYSPAKKGKHDILNGKFAQGLKESPLGQPVDPSKVRELKKKNGGKLPMHIPHALGGPKLGSRPGPDYGSKNKKKEVAGSGLGQRPASASARSRPTSASGGLGPLSALAELRPDPVLSEGIQSKRSTIKKVRQAGFLAKKLFDETASAEQEDNAVSKLNFAERLQCMIMQVQELA